MVCLKQILSSTTKFDGKQKIRGSAAKCTPMPAFPAFSAGVYQS